MFEIIPQPVSVKHQIGQFQITEETVIYCEEEILPLANYLRVILSPSTGFPFKHSKYVLVNRILLRIEPTLSVNGEEGYILKVSETEISITGKTNNGLFYGIQTLRQLFPIDIESKNLNERAWYLPCVEIIDYPAFQWRGFMLDESRHFFGVEVVKQILDIMALHKLNIFHWHLVDDQGWRIEIERYPKLVEIGSLRKLVEVRGEQATNTTLDKYGGYYTKDQIKEIVQYAKERYIETIPEIEMPGHSRAALAAYPSLSCTTEQMEVPTTWGIFQEVYCPGKDSVYEFLKNILEEIIELFPSKIIHIGGDEVPKAYWKKCPDCQNKKKELRLKKTSQLQDYFTDYFANYLEQKSKIIMGWNQILHRNLNENAICQYWALGRREVRKHLRKGRKVVATNYLWTYLDHPYSLISLRKAYYFNPYFVCMRKKHLTNIIGIEAPLWTEKVPNVQRLYWQTFPRLTAYAETAWSPRKKKNYRKFKQKLKKFVERLKLLGITLAVEKI